MEKDKNMTQSHIRVCKYNNILLNHMEIKVSEQEVRTSEPVSRICGQRGDLQENFDFESSLCKDQDLL